MQGVVLSAIDRWKNEEKFNGFQANYSYPGRILPIYTHGYTDIPKTIVNHCREKNCWHPGKLNRIGLYPIDHVKLEKILNRLDEWNPKDKKGYDWDYS